MPCHHMAAVVVNVNGKIKAVTGMFNPFVLGKLYKMTLIVLYVLLTLSLFSNFQGVIRVKQFSVSLMMLKEPQI